MNETARNDDIILIAKKIKAECIRTALESFETASRDGVCCEGAWECAIDAIRNINPLEIINWGDSSEKDN
jgi:hypothetical protein